MRTRNPVVGAVLAGALSIASCDPARDAGPSAPDLPVTTGAAAPAPPPRGRVVVANRGSGTISVIDAHTGVVTATVPLPGETAEPMYVVDVPAMNRVLVGDRANDRVVAFDSRTFEVEGTVPTLSGIWHMWANPQGTQLWVVNDAADAVTVIDPKGLQVVTTIAMPADLTENCGPHDTILDPTAPFAFVSITCASGADWVVRYSTESFQEVGRAQVGEDPHLSLTRQNGHLYVPSQGSGVVLVLDRTTLEAVTGLAVPGAHGAGMTRHGGVFYTTNLPGGGADALFAIDTRTNSVIGAADAPETVPHNIVLSPDGRLLFLTHSGPNNTVTVFATSRTDPVPEYLTTIEVGSNPFGLAWVQ